MPAAAGRPVLRFDLLVDGIPFRVGLGQQDLVTALNGDWLVPVTERRARPHRGGTDESVPGPRSDEHG